MSNSSSKIKTFDAAAEAVSQKLVNGKVSRTPLSSLPSDVYSGVAESRYDWAIAAAKAGRIAFKPGYLNDYLNVEWERPRI